MQEEWKTEPNRKHWIDAATGLDCLIVRGPIHGALCGYVGIPKAHPLHGKGYQDIEVNVHGGLTYARGCSGHICHGEDQGDTTIANHDVWWLGFDTAHAGDYAPILEEKLKQFSLKSPPIMGEKYRNLAYVTRQCESLAKQLHALAA